MSNAITIKIIFRIKAQISPFKKMFPYGVVTIRTTDLEKPIPGASFP